MRVLELFSGAGGLALGIEKAGFTTAALVEKDTKACATLRLNRPHWKVLEGDVRDLDFSALGPVELIAGGPPCQPFSMGGKAKGRADTRDMFPEAVRAVRQLRPAAFLFENVRGLLRPAFSDYVEFIRLQLAYPDFPVSSNVDWTTNLQRLQRLHTSKPGAEDLYYKVTINCVDAADYGVPQRRHRVFFVGLRGDLDAGWSFPKATHSHENLLRAKFVTKEYWAEHGLPSSPIPEGLKGRVQALASGELFQWGDRWQTVRDALAGLPDPRNGESEFTNHVIQSGARVYPGHTGSPLDEPAKALKAGDHGVPGGENMLRHSNGRVRYFTVREAARLQTFPDDFNFPGPWTDNMRQLGNAVPVRLAEKVAASIAAKIQPPEFKICSSPGSPGTSA